MKNLFKKFTCLMISFLLLGCTEPQKGNESSLNDETTNSVANTSNSSLIQSNVDTSSKASSKTNSSVVADHRWSTNWTYDQTNHWHSCRDTDCDEKGDVAPHDFNDWQTVDASSLKGEDQYKYAKAQIKKCQTCGYYELKGENILPELRFVSDNPDEISFATIAKKTDLDRPEVSGKFTLTNCDSKYQLNDKMGTMKVRGNQTANWDKKAFRLKFDKKVNLLGLNNGKAFKKWVLFADAKDTALIRTALGLNIAKAICKDETNIWVSDFTPVSVYLNDQYWGYYYLAEQKEVKSGRVNLPEVSDGCAGDDIGYCFELDYYATNEAQKTDGDPTFTVSYKPKDISYNVESVIANYGAIKTYTVLSDITNKDTQLIFIKNKVESLYTMLYNAVNGNSEEIKNENIQLVKDNFDLDTWVDGFILHAFDCAPDLGYSSFYMSFDNSPTGDHKLRFDCPWDFDSNFGNRNGFIPEPAKASSSGWFGSFDPYYMDRTSNMWLQLFGKLSFFMDMVKVKWNKIRDEKAFENMFHMARDIFVDYDLEMVRNLNRWPTNNAANELRDPFKNTKDYLKARTETINWCAKRIDYLESKWGNGRASVDTNL